MDTGPGYNSKRQEAVETFTAMLGTPLGEKIAQVADDVIVRQMDVPGADVIADRLAAANPLSKIDEDSDVPPQAQMQIQAMQQQIQQMQQALQAAQTEIKMRQSIEQMRQDGATQREHLKAAASVHIEDAENQAWMRDVDEREATKRHDTQVRSTTALSVAEINAFRELLKTRVDNAHDLAKLERKGNEEEQEVASSY
jgi:TolA-binding protein